MGSARGTPTWSPETSSRSIELCSGCESMPGMAASKGPAMHPTGASVEEFLIRVPDRQRREDARRLCTLMTEITGESPAMWGSSIIGFGTYRYRYPSGHEG